MRRSPYKPSSGFQLRGSHVIITIIVLAIAAASFAWAFKYYASRNVLALWGSDAAQLIHERADEVWIDQLRPIDADTPARQQLRIGGESFAIVQSKNISHARGVLNARQALLESKSFVWGQPRGDCRPRWEFVLVFVASETGQRASLAIDTQCGRAQHLETGKEIALDPRIAKALRDFIAEQWKEPGKLSASLHAL